MSYNTPIFYKQHFHKQRQAEIGEVNAKQHPEAEILLFENYSNSPSTLSPKDNRSFSRKLEKETSASVFMRLCD